jgi:plasmid stabilization system protein ParE
VKRYRFHPEARVEVQAAAAWYCERPQEAARGFVDRVFEAIQLIRQQPEAWPFWRGSDVRRRVLRRYPYSIFYLVEEEWVAIVAVAHHEQPPGSWLGRLRG